MVAQAGYSVGPVAANPLRDGRARDLQTFRNAGLNPTVHDHQLDEFQSPGWRQEGVGMGNVRDEGLRLIE